MQMRLGAGACPDHRSQGDPGGDAQEAGAAGWKVPVAGNCSSHCLRKNPGRPNCWTARSPSTKAGRCCPSWSNGWAICSSRALRTYERSVHASDRARLPGADSAPARGRDATASSAPAAANRVYVLSRVTLGADVAVTSVLLDAAKRRYPGAEIVLRRARGRIVRTVRSRSAHPPFSRALCAQRLAASTGCAPRRAVDSDDGIVIDPDSRLTQLGLISVCDDERLFLLRKPQPTAETATILCRCSRLGAGNFRSRECPPVRRAASVNRSACRYHGQSGRRRKSRQAHRRRFRSAIFCAYWPKPERRFWSTKAAARKSASASNARFFRECTAGRSAAGSPAIRTRASRRWGSCSRRSSARWPRRARARRDRRGGARRRRAIGLARPAAAKQCWARRTRCPVERFARGPVERAFRRRGTRAPRKRSSARARSSTTTRRRGWR